MIAWQSYANFIGDVGEAFAISALRSDGFRVQRGEGAGWVGNTIPRGIEKLDALPELECQNLKSLSNLCNQLLRCDVNSVPCQTVPAEFLSAYSSRDTSFGTTDTGDRFFRSYCAGKLTYLVATDQCGSICATGCWPVKAQVQIEHYITSLYYVRHLHPKLTEWFNRWKGAPGRLDLLAVKDACLYAFDVKTNKGKLFEWQILRMAWLKERGFRSGTVRVLLNGDAMTRLKTLYQEIEGQFDEKLKSLPSNEACLRQPELMSFRRDELGKLRATLIPQAISFAVELATPSYSIDEFDLSKYPNVSCYLPTAEQVRQVCELLWCWSSVQRRDGRIRTSRTEKLEELVLKLPIPGDDQALFTLQS